MMSNRYRLCLGIAIFCLCPHVSAAPPLDGNHGGAAAAEEKNLLSLSLRDAIDLSLKNNPDLRRAMERIGEAEAQVGEALAAFYPQVTARVSYEHTNNPSRVFSYILTQRQFTFPNTADDLNRPGSQENFRPEIIANISLFRGGQDYQRTKIAELGVESATLEHEATRNSLIEAVTATYYAYLAAKETHGVALRSIEAVESELTQTRNRFEAGSALKSDLLSLEVQLAEARETEIRTANAIELTLAGAKTLLGLKAAEALRFIRTGTMPTPTLPGDFDALLDTAMTGRPEVQVAAREVEMAQRRLKAAQGAHLPRADAYVSYGADRSDFGFSAQQDNVTAGVTMEVDLFSGFATQEKIRQAERQLNQAKEAQRRVSLQIEQEVKSAFLNLKEALQRVKVAEASVAAAEEALRLVSEQRKAGAVTVTHYIDTEVARDGARARSIAARYDALRAEAGLNKALGKLN